MPDSLSAWFETNARCHPRIVIVEDDRENER